MGYIILLITCFTRVPCLFLCPEDGNGLDRAIFQRREPYICTGMNIFHPVHVFPSQETKILRFAGAIIPNLRFDTPVLRPAKTHFNQKCQQLKLFCDIMAAFCYRRNKILTYNVWPKRRPSEHCGWWYTPLHSVEFTHTTVPLYHCTTERPRPDGSVQFRY